MEIVKKALKRILTAEPFVLHAEYFPEDTRDIFSKEEILKFGVLALGHKRKSGFGGTHKFLNVGFLRSYDRRLVAKVKAILEKKKNADGIQCYQLELSQFLTILKEIYNISSEEIYRKDVKQLDPTLFKNSGAIKRVEF